MDKRNNVKTLAAVIGASAVVAMAAVGIAISQQASGNALASNMNLGGTSTETTPSTLPVVAKAAPSIRGKAPFKAHS